MHPLGGPMPITGSSPFNRRFFVYEIDLFSLTERIDRGECTTRRTLPISISNLSSFFLPLVFIFFFRQFFFYEENVNVIFLMQMRLYFNVLLFSCFIWFVPTLCCPIKTMTVLRKAIYILVWCFYAMKILVFFNFFFLRRRSFLQEWLICFHIMKKKVDDEWERLSQRVFFPSGITLCCNFLLSVSLVFLLSLIRDRSILLREAKHTRATSWVLLQLFSIRERI